MSGRGAEGERQGRESTTSCFSPLFHFGFCLKCSVKVHALLLYEFVTKKAKYNSKKKYYLLGQESTMY